MALIDTHAHLYLPQFDQDRQLTIQRALAEGVEKIFLPNIDLATLQPMLQLCDEFPEVCYPMLGLHPCSVTDDYEKLLFALKQQIDKRKYWGIGETGIDLYWDKSSLPIQIESFKIQVGWAKEFGLPLIIHARESYNEIFQVLDNLNDVSLKGIFHCFTGSIEQANHISDYGGFMMGIGGVITYEKSGLDKVVPHISMDKLVLETDSPYLAPKPHRGKRNESGYTRIIAEKVALSTGHSVEEIEEITTSNARGIFQC